MATERVIDLTESEALAAALEALGLNRQAALVSREDSVVKAFRELIRETGGLVTCGQVGNRLGITDNSVAHMCRRLVARGRMLRIKNQDTGKMSFIPRAEP